MQLRHQNEILSVFFSFCNVDLKQLTIFKNYSVLFIHIIGHVFICGEFLKWNMIDVWFCISWISQPTSDLVCYRNQYQRRIRSLSNIYDWAFLSKQLTALVNSLNFKTRHKPLTENIVWKVNQKKAYHYTGSFPLRNCLANVSKSAGNCCFCHIYWRNPK